MRVLKVSDEGGEGKGVHLGNGGKFRKLVAGGESSRSIHNTTNLG